MLGVSTGSKGKGFFFRRACVCAGTGRAEGGGIMTGYDIVSWLSGRRVLVDLRYSLM